MQADRQRRVHMCAVNKGRVILKPEKLLVMVGKYLLQNNRINNY